MECPQVLLFQQKEAKQIQHANRFVPISVNFPLVDEQGSLPEFAGVVPPLMAFEGKPEVSHHDDVLLWPILLLHGIEHLVVCLTELFPG